MLAKMRYKTFTFPHNPGTYQIDFSRQMVEHHVPNGIYVLQSLGRNSRIFRGEGEFYGEHAYDLFKELACLFYDDSAGELYHPIWQTSRAYFTELYLKQEPREDYVVYGFTFQEGFFGYDQIAPSTGVKATSHVLGQGETLLGVALANGMTLAELLDKNPAIGNPNTAQAGLVVAL